MRNAITQDQHPIPESDSPSDRYLELREDLIRTEQKAESLELATTRAEDDDVGVAEESRVGVVRVRRPPRKVPLPASSEQLRLRLRIWGLSWRITAAKSSGHALFKDLTAQTFSDHVEYLLGEDVFRLEATGPTGKVLSKPSIELVVAYDFAIRKETAQLMNGGASLHDALTQARKDTAVRERKFLTPLMLGNAVRGPRSPSRNRNLRANRGNKQRQQRVDRSRTPRRAPPEPKPINQKVPQGWNTEDGGKPICMNFNKGKCKFKSCKYLHQCAICGKTDHAARSCTASGGGKSSQGARD